MAFQGKAAVVVGGSGGIGMELCKHLLRNGLSKLAILDKNEISEDVRYELLRYNKDAAIFTQECDIAKKEHLEYVISKRVLLTMKYIDLFVNSVGIVDERDADRLIAINLTGVINSSLFAMNRMSKENPGRKGGIIVNVSSIAGLEPTPCMSVYSASKFGVTGFTRSMANDMIYNRTGVKFITICPGVTDTTLLSKFFAGEDLLFPWMDGVASEVKKQYPAQSPSAVGECLVQAILDGENGAVWISVDGSNYKMEVPANQFVKRTSTG